MAKVFVLCVGGTGLRVMKSVTMLLSAGFDSKGYTVIPIIVDPHQDLQERTNLNDLIESYIKIYDDVTGKDTSDVRTSPQGFFGTEMKMWQKLDNEQNPTSSGMASEETFKSYIGVNNMSSNDLNQYLVQTLFSDETLNNKLSVGFKGNPNVGTVVLGNIITGEDWFAALKRHCDKDDRIFIISSIFGGTGASGYPLIEKEIKNSTSHPNLHKALMGAVTVLPYFALDDPTVTGSSIDSSNFMTKTKAALSYYENTVKSDYLYYIGDSNLKVSYENDESKQDDKAHFIELVAATALFDFLGRTRQDAKVGTQYMSRAIRDDQDVLDLETAGDGYKDVIKALADMTLLDKLLQFVKNEKRFPLKKTSGFDKDFYNDQPFKRLEEFISRFSSWRDEIAGNKRGFSPVNNCEGMNSPVKGVSINAKQPDYVLEMIRQSNKTKDEEKNLSLRHLLDVSYKAIDKYTQKIMN